jgi:hypothetical protein
MPQDLSAVKSDVATRLSQMAERLLDTLEDAVRLESFWDDRDFAIAKANEIKQEDLVGENAHLTPADLANVVSAIGTLKGSLTGPIRKNLRRASRRPPG